jgi:hypothetical protein
MWVCRRSRQIRHLRLAQDLRLERGEAVLHDLLPIIVMKLYDGADATRSPNEIGDHQSSLASMMVSTRVVFAGSAGSSEPNCIARS